MARPKEKKSQSLADIIRRNKEERLPIYGVPKDLSAFSPIANQRQRDDQMQSVRDYASRVAKDREFDVLSRYPLAKENAIWEQSQREKEFGSALRAQAAEEAQNKPLKSLTVEDWAKIGAAIPDKMRFFPDATENDWGYVADEYLNPFLMIGNMAAGLGTIPQSVKQGAYMDAAVAAATPVVAGLAEGMMGAPSSSLSWRMRTAPYRMKAAWDDIAHYKGNPEQYMYRGVGPEGLEDALRRGKLTTPEWSEFRGGGGRIESGNYFDDVTPQREVYYSPYTKDALQYAAEGAPGFPAIIAEVPKNSAEFNVGLGIYPSQVWDKQSPWNQLRKQLKSLDPESEAAQMIQRQMDDIRFNESPRPPGSPPKQNYGGDWSQYTSDEIPVSQAKFYEPSWLWGLKQIRNPEKRLAQIKRKMQ